MWRLESCKHIVGSTRRVYQIPMLFVYGTAEQKMNTGFVGIGRKEMSLQLEKRMFLIKV